MSAHIGKIGRLPAEIREQLNERLENGEAASPILEWLNGLPAVQEMIAARFSGNPINEQNLTNWRGGGFEDWQRQQERRSLVEQIIEEIPELDAATGGNGAAQIAQYLSTILIIEMAHAARRLASVADPADRWRQAHRVIRDFSQIQRETHRAARAELQKQRAEAPIDLDLFAPAPHPEPTPTAPVPGPKPPRPAPAPEPGSTVAPAGLQEVSKVLNLYPDLPLSLCFAQSLAEANQGESR